MAKATEDQGFTCCICGKPIKGEGNNPYPVVKHEMAWCCDDCNFNIVIPARIRAITKREVLNGSAT